MAPCFDLSPESLYVSMEGTVGPYSQPVARKGVLATAVVLVLQSSSLPALGIDSKIYGFPRRPW